MDARTIFNLRKPCLNRGVVMVDNKDGTVTINGHFFISSKEAEDYLLSLKRID